MKTLALELSTSHGSLAWLDGEIEFMQQWPNDRKNSASFFDNLQAVRRKFGAPQTITVGLGPGSYAGTRIAISAAIGIQLSCDARLIGYPSICAMESDAQEYCAIGDARRKSFFFARILKNQVIEGPTLLSELELKATLESLDRATPVFSSELLPQFDRRIISFPSALILARVAQDSRRSFCLPPLEPIYLREPHITIPNERNLPLLG
jgi:tRNA threonylcarbamoyl adenosine modification protein YeaZ